MKIRLPKTLSEYQVNKLIKSLEEDFDKQWEDRVQEIQDKTFESVKLDMFSQFMSCSMAVLEMNNGFTKEQLTEYYNNYIALLQTMNMKPLGKDFTPQDCIDHNKKELNIDTDKMPL